MKIVLSTAAALIVSAAAAQANPNYPLPVTENGQKYLCKNEIVDLADGRKGRMCIKDDDDAGGALFGGGFGSLGGVGAGFLTLALVGAAMSGNSDSTNGTN